MADPISVLGTAGAVANIIDVLAKVITTFAELRSQWQEADFTLLALESELSALNAALNKIKEWVEYCSDDPHHQLVMDLDRCVVCCQVLIGRIDAEISQFQVTPATRLDVTSKLRFLLKKKDFEHIQQMIGKQTAAMTLLLTACNTTMLSKQKFLLVDSNTRKFFKKMEDDTASLLVHRDVDSLVTRTATSVASSRRPIIFDFDPKLFTSKIYQRWIRGSVKKFLLQQQYGRISAAAFGSRMPQPDENFPAQRSRDIDNALTRERKLLRREVKILVAGDQSRVNIVHRMRLLNSMNGPDRQLRRYRPLIFAHVLRCAKAMVKAMMEQEHDPEEDDSEVWKHIGNIADAPDIEVSSSPPPEGLDPMLVAGIVAIVDSPYFAMDQYNEFGLPNSTEYFLSRIQTIASPQYVPTSSDIMRAEISNGHGVSENLIHLDSLTLHLFDPIPPDNYGTPKKIWLRFCEDAFAMIFVVDLSCYDQPLPGYPDANQLVEIMRLFERVVNSHSLRNTPVILCFSKVDVFLHKLNTSPVNNHFDDFKVDFAKSTSASYACKYFYRRFTTLDRTRRRIYVNLVSDDDPDIMGRIAKNIRSEIVEQNGRLVTLL